MRVGRPVSQLTYRRQFRRRFGFAALKCQCGCGQYTRTDARFLAGHEPDSETFEEMHRRLIAEPQRYPDDLIAKANQLYEEGLSTLAVARRLRVSQAWVHKATNTLSPKDARSLGVKRPRGGGKNRKELPVAAIIADYDNGRGLEPRALANKYGVSHATIRNRLREAGVYRLLWHQ
jgi:transposase